MKYFVHSFKIVEKHFLNRLHKYLTKKEFANDVVKNVLITL